MFYHLVKKHRNSPAYRKAYYWYYWYIDPISGKQVQKACIDCKTRDDAEKFIDELPDPIRLKKPVSLHSVVKDMYIPGSAHVNRLQQYGKSLTIDTLKINRKYVCLFDKLWGNIDIREISALLVDSYLLQDTHSGSWKNSFIENMNAVLEEAKWYGAAVQLPGFHRFARQPNKPDILTTAELNKLFVPDNFDTYELYIMFLTTVSGGLRLGEIRGLRRYQVLINQNELFIDGFMRNKERTSFNKKGSEKKPKYRITVIPSYVMKKLADFILQSNLEENDFVFSNNGIPYRKEFCEDVLRRAVKRAGLSEDKRFVPHSLRYTFVTRMRRNLSAEEVMGMVGHTDIEMTEAYNRAALPELIESVNKPEIGQSANMLFS